MALIGLTRKSSPSQRAFEAIGAVLGLAALALQLYVLFVNATALGRTPAGIVVQFFSYFTILSNILVVLCYLGARFGGRLGQFFAGMGVKTAIALYIAIVGLVYVIVLRPLWNPEGLAKLADVALHYVTPLVYLAYWLVFVDKAKLRYADVAAWLIFPIAYCAYALVRGAFVAIYPYPFLEANKIGYAHVAMNILVLVVLFALIGFVIVAAGRAIARRKRGAL